MAAVAVGRTITAALLSFAGALASEPLEAKKPSTRLNARGTSGCVLAHAVEIANTAASAAPSW